MTENELSGAALEFKQKIHKRCSYCKHYEKISETCWKCMKCTDPFLCRSMDFGVVQSLRNILNDIDTIDCSCTRYLSTAIESLIEELEEK